MAKFLSETGLSTVWSKIDTYFLRKTDFNSSTYADTVPTQNSSKLITSGGMYNVLEELEDVVAASENSLNNRLSTIEGMNLVIGTGLTADKLVLGNGNSTVKTSSKGITTVAPSSSSDDTTIPTSAAVNSAISSALGTVAGALKYKGAVASNSALPATHSVGDVYVVSTAGTFAGKACEVGDYIICKASGTAANNADWDVLNGENQVSNASASLAAAGSSATIATVDGTDITVTTPSTWTGVDKTGTITKVGNTTSGEASVTSADATIGTDLTTIGTVGGVNIKAKIGSYSSSSHTHDLSIATDSGTNALTMAANTKYKLTAGGKTFIFTTPPDGNTDTKVTQTPTTSSNSSWRPLILGSSHSDATTFTISTATDVTSSTHVAKFKPSTGVMAVVGLNKMTTSGTVTTGSDTTVWNTNGGTVSLGGYVKLDPGAAEQTIKSSIGSFSKGVINLWRNSGDHYTFLGFSNGTTETALGGIGFKSQADHNLYRKDGSNYYKIWDENNYTTWINTTNFPGINSTGTITKVGNTTSGAVTVSSANNTAAFGSAVTVGSVGGVELKFTMPANPNSNTTYTFASGTTNGAFSVTPSGGTAQSVSIYGLKSAAYTESSDYVKLNPGTVEQTISSGIGTAVNGVINLYRSNGNYVSYIGFSNKQNNAQTLLGLIGFTNSGTFSYRQPDGTTYTVLHSGNYSNSAYADTVPTENSTKLITSGGMYAVLDEIESTLAASEDALNTRVTTLENNTITGSGLTADKIVLGNGTRTVKTSSKGITTTAPSSSSDDTTIPTSKAVNSAIASHAGVDKTGTVTSVTLTQGTGITVSSSGTAITGSGSRTISLASVSGLTAGTYRSVTVDTYGRVTAGTNPTTLSGYGITDAKIASGVITLGSNTITPLTSASTLDATKLSGTIPSSCYTNTDIRLADFFGESTNTASTVAKTTSTTSKSIAPGDLVTGLCAIIYHRYANSAASATLNVGGSGAKAMYNAVGTRISGSTGTWAAYDIIRWVYDSSLNSGSGGWKISAILGNGSSHRLRLLTGRDPLYSYTETYQGTVTSVTPGTGLRNGTATTAITSSGTLNLISATTGELGGIKAAAVRTTTPTITTGGTTTGRYYGVELDANGKAFVNVPWTAGTSDAVTGVQLRFRAGDHYDVLRDAAGNAITYTPTNGTVQIGAIPQYREDAEWGDYVWRWEGTTTDPNTGVTTTHKSGCIWKNGEQILYGNTHIANTLAFWQAGTHQLDTEAHYLSTGTIGAAFYANNNGGGDANSSAFYINVCTAAGGWNTHQVFRFTKDGIYTNPTSGRTGITGWFINESDALTNSEIDSILANAT